MRACERTHDKYRHAGIEPRLDEVLADPLVHLVMARDRVGLAALQAVIADAQCRLRIRPCPRIAA
jgi:hypothetical protein